MITDGLSSKAVTEHAVATLAALIDGFDPSWTVAPPVLVTQAWVAIGDWIGQVLGAKTVLVLGGGVALVWIVGALRNPVSSAIFGRFTAADTASQEFVQFSAVVCVVSLAIRLALAELIVFGALRFGHKLRRLS